MNSDKIILSLCDYSGVWSAPYVAMGYQVIRVDNGHPHGAHLADDGAVHVGCDVREFDHAGPFYAVLAAPPCTCFCRPGARWWKRQDERGETQRDIEVFRACLRICQTATGWWALENPPGRHQKLIEELGPPAWQYRPFEYGDAWDKQTYIWGTAVKPPVVAPVKPAPTRRTPNGRSQGRIAFMSSSHQRQRSETPGGFAKAFAEVNP